MHETPKTMPEKVAEILQDIQRNIDSLEQKIHDIAELYIPDYHWMDYFVSTFWKCEQSPIGLCVFTRDQMGNVLGDKGCRYYGDPLERK